MDMKTCELACSLYERLIIAARAVDALNNNERPLYFYQAGRSDAIYMPDETRAELIRHFLKVKQSCVADIEAL
jgi:hypothetical protein